jgi:hypothetical protein
LVGQPWARTKHAPNLPALFVACSSVSLCCLDLDLVLLLSSLYKAVSVKVYIYFAFLGFLVLIPL